MSERERGNVDRPASQGREVISFRAALRFWLKLGFISFGGPAGQISVMHQELVERRRWISEGRFLHALNYAMLLPGPEAQQLATYIGWLMHGTVGGLAAGLLFVLPSLLLLMLLSWIYLVFGDVTFVSGILYGIKPAVTAIVLFAAYRIGSKVLNNAVLWAIAGCGFIAIFALNVPFPAIVVGAAVFGFVASKWYPQWFQSGGGHAQTLQGLGAAIIDDDTPAPAHARFAWSRVAWICAIGIGLWSGVLAVLWAQWGADGVFTQMGVFFTKAALVTFGGAYAVLPYVYQGGVETFGWLSGPQMIDGLALGETTPGPLIMVVSFVGFLGGWNQAALGPEALLLAAIVGACVATFFTFLPSFMFIFLGGPIVEATREGFTFAAPLTAITAVVVGVIINLAVFFALHVLWPAGLAAGLADGLASHFEWFAAIIGALAFVALFRFGVGVIPVIAASGLAGLLYSFALGA